MLKPMLSPDKLRQAIATKQFDQAELARRAGMNKQQLYNVLTRPDSDPSISTVARLAQALKMRIEDLLEMREVEPSRGGKRTR